MSLPHSIINASRIVSYHFNSTTIFSFKVAENSSIFLPTDTVALIYSRSRIVGTRGLRSMIDTGYREKVLCALNLMKGSADVGLDESGRVAPLATIGSRLRLRPIKKPMSSLDVELIAAWRNEHRESFFTWFTATAEGTSKWLGEVISSRDRILFMTEVDQTAFGHIGLRNFDYAGKSCEVDNVLRGRSGVMPGGMTYALRGLLVWLRSLQMNSTELRVFSDNAAALNLYCKCGFLCVKEMPLVRVDDGGSVSWVELLGGSEGRDVRYATLMRADLD